MTNKEIVKIIQGQNKTISNMTFYMESISYMRKDLNEMKIIVGDAGKRVEEIEKKLEPISNFYNFAKIGKSIFTWSVGILAAAGSAYLIFRQIFIK